MIKALLILMAVGLLILGIVIAEGRRELKFFRMRRYRLRVPKFQALDSPKRVILLADLHNKVYGKENEELVEAVRREKPDMILVAGDMLVGKEKMHYEEAVQFLIQLPRIAPVYYSLGNHEQRLKEYPEKYGAGIFKEYKDTLSKAGIRFLENEGADCMLDRLAVRITGLTLPMAVYEKFKKHTVTSEDISRCLGSADREKYQILLAHNPVYFPAYKEWGADLTVSGHLHGGIIRLPVLGGVITPQFAFFPKYSGEMTVEGDQAVAVSRGLGTHTVNLRFLNYAEVVVIDLMPFDIP